MYFKGKADAGDFGPRIAKVNKTGRPDGRRLFGNGSISYGGVKKRSISGRCGRCADLRRVPSGQNETSLPVARGDGGKVSAGRCGRVQGGDEEETDFVEFVASREFVARDPEFVVDTPGSVDVLIRLLDEGKISEKTYDDVLRAIATKKES
jgi:hypothetical protein